MAEEEKIMDEMLGKSKNDDDQEQAEQDNLLQDGPVVPALLQNDNANSNEILFQNSNIQVEIARPAFNQQTFDEQYEKETKPELPVLQQLKRKCAPNKCCSKDAAKRKILKLFPFIGIMKNYRWKKWIVSDIIAGICVGVIQIPQCMGFSLLASLPPVYGLYSTIFPVILYFFFGTSRHISMGTMAIISIMISSVIEREIENLPPGSFAAPATNLPGQTLLVDPNNNITYNIINENVTVKNGFNNSAIQDGHMNFIEFKVGIAVSITFIAGAIQFLMSVFNLDIVATFMSMPFNGGFMTGAAFHIITSQVPPCLGVKIPGQSGLFRLPKIWYWICRSITQANPPTVIISLISMLFLFICKEIINVKFKSKLKIPIPAELIVIVIATMISYFANINDRFNVQIIEDIPTGIPAPKIPSFYNAQNYIIDAFIIAVISFAISISLAKIFSQKYHYAIDPKQELLALGIMHTVTSFFHGFAGAQAPPRTFVIDGTGGKTQLAGVVSAVLVLSVVLFIAPLFEALPNCILGSVIIIALLPLLKQFQDLPMYWRINRNDFIVWLITWVCVVFLNIDMGLWVGLAVSVLTVILQHNKTKGRILAKADGTELYRNTLTYKGIKDLTQCGIYIFNFDAPLYFANVDAFKKELFCNTLNPDTLRKQENNKPDEVLIEQAVEAVSERGSQIINTEETNPEETNAVTSENPNDQNVSKSSFLLSHKKFNYLFDNKKPPPPLEMKILSHVHKPNRNGTIIFDCSAISYIDMMGLNTLKSLTQAYSSVSVELVFANCSSSLLHKMESHKMDVNTKVYPSIQDAVVITQESLFLDNNANI